MAAFPADSGSRLAGLAKSLLPLKQLNGMRITTAIKGLRELPGVLKQYETLNVRNLVAQLDQLNPRLKSLAASANALKLAFNKMPSSLRTVASATRTVTSANRSLESSQNSVTRSTGSLIAKFGLLNMGFHYLWNGLAKCINEVNTYIENMNLFEASMGRYTESATEFGNTVQDVMGIDFGQWARNQGVFQTLITGMGDTADRAAVMSQQLTQLGYDISSFYNIPVEDAMLKLQSGMAGELEPLRRLGWDLSNARMQLEATKLGIEASVQEMTQAEKVGLRYYLIMNQVTQVHGDMARTIASPANQLRVLQAQVTLAARAIGGLLIPMLNAILPYAIAAAKAIRILAQTIAGFFGIDATFEVDYSTLDLSGIASGVDTDGVDDLADSLDDAGSAASDANDKVKELKNSVMGFDELNKLVDQPEETAGAGKGGKGAGAGGVGGLDLPLDGYDFLDGLNDYITKLSDDIAEKMVGALKKIAPLVAGIGAGFAAWKIGRSLMKELPILADKLGKASGNALKFANNLGKAGKLRLANIVGDVGVGLGLIGSKLGSIAKTLGVLPLATIAATVAVIVARTVDLWINSEKFRDGIAQIVEWLSMIPAIVADIPNIFENIAKWAGEVWQNIKKWASSLGIDLSFLDPVMKAFKEVADFIGGGLMAVVEALDLDFADLAITIAGVALVATGVGGPLGAILLAFEAITVAIRAVGWATEDCMQHVDALADVSEDTAKKFGTSLDSMEAAIKEIDEINFADAVVTDEDVQSVGAKCEDIRDTILNNLDAKRNEELASIDAMAGFMTDDEIASAKARVNESYDQQKEAVTAGTAEINEILMTAKDNNVALSQEQSDRINEILDQQYQQLIETSGASSEEIAKINEAMKNNNETAALQAAESVIQEARRVRDERKATAEEDYQNQVAVAQKLYEAGDIDKRRYEEIVASAEQAKNLTLQHADEQYQGIVQKTEQGLGEASNKFDFHEGKMKSNWDIFWQDMATSAGTWLGDIKEKYQTWERETGEAFRQFGADIERAWGQLCADIDSWYRNNIEPMVESLKAIMRDAGESIGRFLSDPIGTIQNAWSAICSWFDQNVVQPISNTFEGVYDAITAPFRWARDAIKDIFDHMHVDFTTYDLPFGSFTIPTGIQFYAKGGFPTSGQLFMAREDGRPELVGSMGNRSAVANNQQIVEGIEQGVMSAMVQVLPSFMAAQGEGDVTLVLQVGHEELARATNKGNASMARRGQIKPEIAFA